MKMRAVKHLSAAIIAVLLAAVVAAAQTRPVPRTIFIDSDGCEITNNEFVDIRVANPHLPDATLMRTLEDGATEFRLQKIPQEGGQAPDFTVRTLAGDEIRMADLKGKVVVLNFWFIGCPACMDEMPKLNLLRTKFAGREEDIVFLSMTADRRSAVERFTQRERFDYIHAADAEPAMKMFNFVGYPKNIVISRTGEIVYWRSTVKAWYKFESVISDELKK